VDTPLDIIQITDLHIAHPPRKLPDSSLTTEDSLMTVLRTIERDEEPAFLLCTGDLANHPDPTAYRRLHEIFGTDGCPVYCLPGNHDDPAMAQQAAIAQPSRLRWSKVITHGNWVIIMLDSHIEGRIDGRLSDSELRFLDQTLAAHADHEAVVCLHHHSEPMQSRWLDNHILQNPAEFYAVTDQYPQLRAILWGHVHQAWAGYRGHTQLLSTPSTCFQFLPRSDDFAFDTRPPAYRRIQLHPNGDFTSKLIFCELTL